MIIVHDYNKTGYTMLCDLNVHRAERREIRRDTSTLPDTLPAYQNCEERNTSLCRQLVDPDQPGKLFVEMGRGQAFFYELANLHIVDKLTNRPRSSNASLAYQGFTGAVCTENGKIYEHPTLERSMNLSDGTTQNQNYNVVTDGKYVAITKNGVINGWTDGSKHSDGTVSQWIALEKHLTFTGIEATESPVGFKSGGLYIVFYPLKEEHLRTGTVPQKPMDSRALTVAEPVTISSAAPMAIGRGGIIKQSVTADDGDLGKWNTTDTIVVHICPIPSDQFELLLKKPGVRLVDDESARDYRPITSSSGSAGAAAKPYTPPPPATTPGRTLGFRGLATQKPKETLTSVSADVVLVGATGVPSQSPPHSDQEIVKAREVERFFQEFLRQRTTLSVFCDICETLIVGTFSGDYSPISGAEMKCHDDGTTKLSVSIAKKTAEMVVEEINKALGGGVRAAELIKVNQGCVDESERQVIILKNWLFKNEIFKARLIDGYNFMTRFEETMKHLSAQDLNLNPAKADMHRSLASATHLPAAPLPVAPLNHIVTHYGVPKLPTTRGLFFPPPPRGSLAPQPGGYQTLPLAAPPSGGGYDVARGEQSSLSARHIRENLRYMTAIGDIYREINKLKLRKNATEKEQTMRLILAFEAKINELKPDDSPWKALWILKGKSSLDDANAALVALFDDRKIQRQNKPISVQLAGALLPRKEELDDIKGYLKIIEDEIVAMRDAALTAARTYGINV
jgi:hypothetical protein